MPRPNIFMVEGREVFRASANEAAMWLGLGYRVVEYVWKTNFGYCRA